ncbi:hypothetical protein [Tenacibaculum sp. 190130A14a]|uniref:hypothetical protein n=1 Tax=Tenacibaculum polynesiense TaxID=3137857 RepID=UPI0032B14A65
MKHNILSDDKFIVKRTFNPKTNEVGYPMKTELGNLNIIITDKGAYIKNSIHSYFNYFTESKIHNCNDFSLCDLKFIISQIEKELNYNLKDTKLNSLEFGFNLDLNFPVEKFIIENVLMYKLKSHCFNPKDKANMVMKKFKSSNYEIKIYDKSGHLNYYKPNILRIEIRYKTSKEFNKFGIYNLTDLKNPLALDMLFNDFINKFSYLTIIDSYNGNIDTPQKERLKLIKYTNPNFWIETRNKHHPNTLKNRKDDFERIMSKYNLDNWKNTLISLLYEKYQHLSKDECNQSIPA